MEEKEHTITTKERCERKGEALCRLNLRPKSKKAAFSYFYYYSDYFYYFN